MSAQAFVIGNVAWDETLQLAALPAPGASIHVRRGAAGLGGKGANQAVVLARAGIDVSLVAVIGTDTRGDAVAAILAAEGLDAGLVRLADVETDWSAVLVTAAGENAILTTRAAAQSLDAATIIRALAAASPGDLCVLQGNLLPDTTAAAVDAARQRGMVIALNPSPFARELADLFADVDIVFVNRDEALAFTGLSGAAAAEALVVQDARRVVMTLGAEGALLASKVGVETVPAVSAHLVDPTGAGDTLMAAALAHAAPAGWLPDAPALVAATQAAALSIGRSGAFASLPSRRDLASIIGVR